jgi:autotransporter-associated beta strand protein
MILPAMILPWSPPKQESSLFSLVTAAMNAGRSSLLVAAAWATLVVAAWNGPAQAGVQLTWNSSVGGSGTWNTTTANWWTGLAYRAWLNANLDDALFAGTAGTVNVGAPVTVHNMTFSVSGYTLSSTSPAVNYITLGGTSPAITVNAGTASISARLSGTAGLTKAGAGTLNLAPTATALNNYSGTTVLSAGTLTFTNGGLGSTSSINFTGNSALQWASGNTQTVSAPVSVASGVTATLNTGANTVTLSGAVSGEGGLAKAGSGTLNLSVANGYTGDTTLNGGTVGFVSGGLGSGGNITFSANSTLRWADGNTDDISTRLQPIGAGVVATLDTGGTNTVTLSSWLGGQGGIAKAGGGKLVLASENYYSGPTTLSAGTLSFISNGLLYTSRITFSGNATLQWADGNTDDVSSLIQPLGSGTNATLDTAGNSVAFLSALSGAGGITKAGSGLLEFWAANSHTGATKIAAGTLRLTDSGALPALSNVNLSGGVVELNYGDYLSTADFTRALGTGAGQVQFTSSGGFSAYGMNRTVNLGGAGNPATVTWGSGGFVPDGAALILGSSNNYGTVEFQNPIVLGSTARTVQVDRGPYQYAAVDGRLGGMLSDGGGGSGGLTKTGTGTLELSTWNYYGGATRVEGGVLRLSGAYALPSTSNLVIAGGVVDLAAGNFTRAVGTDSGQVQFIGSGGFSASGADRVVNLGNDKHTVDWGTANFLPDGAVFILGSSADDATLDFQNPINLGSQTRQIQIDWGLAFVDAKLSGALSGSSGSSGSGLTKSGYGTLELAKANTYSGPTTVAQGTLRLSDPLALPGGAGATGGASNLTIAGGVVDLAAGNFSRALGTGAAQVQFTGSGGFSASGANRTVHFFFTGDDTVTWGSGSFVPDGQSLVLGALCATATVDFQNPINLAGAGRTIEVNAGLTTVAGKISGAISSNPAGGGLTKTGYGTLDLTAANAYTGPTTVTNGTLRLSNAAALPGGTGPGGAGSNLVFNGSAAWYTGGVVELTAASGDFTRTLGTAPDQVQFSGSGGFSAAGVDRTANLGAQVTWASGYFVPDGQKLMLGSSSADHTLDFQSAINLNGAVRTVYVSLGTNTVEARLSGILSSTPSGGGLTKVGAGTLELTAANTYTGSTLVADGTLRLGNATALPGGTGATGGTSNLNLAGGVVDLTAASGNFARGLGTGATQVQFTASGGFSASGAERTVNLGGGLTPATVTWDSGSFVPAGASLVLGSPQATATLDFRNPIDLKGGIRTVQTNDGPAAVDGRLSGALSSSTGGGGLAKTGDGTLDLTGVNTYAGQTKVSGGVLRLSNANALPGGIGSTGGTSNLNLVGGVVELTVASGDFARGLGTGVSQVRFTGSGGFSASGAERSVNLGGALTPVTVTWGSGSFVPAGASLVLGSSTATAKVDFQNPINLGATTRTIQVDAGSAPAADARLSGALSGTGGLIKSGYGVLELSGTNTYSGGTTVNAGELNIIVGQAVPAGGNLVLGPGARVVFRTGLILGSDASLAVERPAAISQPVSAATVPEPGTLVLLAAAILGLAAARLRKRDGWR